MQQVGEVPEQGVMIWHICLRSPEFLDCMSVEMERLHNNTADNWQELVTVKTLFLIVQDLLRRLRVFPTPPVSFDFFLRLQTRLIDVM